jgi:hypothetical protein
VRGKRWRGCRRIGGCLRGRGRRRGELLFGSIATELVFCLALERNGIKGACGHAKEYGNGTGLRS